MAASGVWDEPERSDSHSVAMPMIKEWVMSRVTMPDVLVENTSQR